MKILVTVTETYTHTYCVEAESKEDAIKYAEDKELFCDRCNDYCGEIKYEARLPKGEDLSMYEYVKD